MSSNKKYADLNRQVATLRIDEYIDWLQTKHMRKIFHRDQFTKGLFEELHSSKTADPAASFPLNCIPGPGRSGTDGQHRNCLFQPTAGPQSRIEDPFGDVFTMLFLLRTETYRCLGYCQGLRTTIHERRANPYLLTR